MKFLIFLTIFIIGLSSADEAVAGPLELQRQVVKAVYDGCQEVSQVQKCVKTGLLKMWSPKPLMGLKSSCSHDVYIPRRVYCYEKAIQSFNNSSYNLILEMCSYKKLKSYQKVNRCFDKELDQAAKLADYRSDFGFSNQLKAISRYIFTGLGSGSLDLNMSKGELIKTPGMVLLKSLADKRLTDLEVLGGRCLTRRPECISSVLKILKNAQLQDINMSCLRAGGGFNLQFLNRAKYITCFDQKAKQHKALSVLPWHRLVAEGNRYPVGKRFLFRIRFASTEVAPNDITVSGPAGLVVGSSGKVVFWDTTAADIGTHRFSVKFTMSGVVHEKSFAMEVYDPLHAAWKDGFPLGPINQNITLRGTCVAKTHLIGSGLAPINKKTWAATYQLTFKGNTPGPLYVADGNYQALKLYPSTRYELRNGSWFVQLKYGEIKGMLYKGQIKVKSGYALDLSKGGKYKKLRGTNCTYTGQLY